MARLTDPESLTCYRNALANWRYRGYVVFSSLAAEWIRKNVGEPLVNFAQRMHDFVESGGEVDQVIETRPEWSFRTHHYDLRPVVAGQVLYIETVLDYDDAGDEDDPMITVVNVHLA